MEVQSWFTCPECGRVARRPEGSPGKCPECSARFVELASPTPDAVGNASVLATRLVRLAGYLADQVVSAVLLVPALYVAARQEAVHRTGIEGFLSALTMVSVVSVVYYAVPTALWGQTFGKWLVGTKVVGPDGQAPGWGRAWLRAVVALVADLLSNLIVGVLDPLWLLWDRRRQTLHDKAAGTVVIVTHRRRPVAILAVSILLAAGAQALLVFALIRPFIVQAYYVPSGSMHYTLMEQDRLLANKLSYRYGHMQRGDIIVFRAPRYVTGGKRQDFVKRLMGLPGDKLQVREGRLFVNDRPLDEPYLAEQFIRYNWGPVTVPPGHVVAMGDNRNNSNDAHAWTDGGKPAPFLPLASIHGRAFYRFWPWVTHGAIQ